MRSRLAGTLLAAIQFVSTAATAFPPCKTSTKLVGKCFVVHGRLDNLYQGGWTTKIWVVGTHRMLGVEDVDQLAENRDDPALPRNIQRALGQGPGKPYSVYGDFEVCPFSPEHRGWMREVCVQSGKNLVRKPDF